MEEEQLLIEARKGNQLAFEALIKPYMNSGVLFAYQYTKDFHIAEDMVQDAFVKFYCRLEEYDPRIASLKTYLFTIIKRLCIDYHRKKRFSLISLKDPFRTSLYFLPEEVVLAQEKIHTLEKCMNKLSMKQREAIHLKEYENMTYKEIAKIMNTEVINVKAYLHRGRKKLWTLFQKEMKDHEMS